MSYFRALRGSLLVGVAMLAVALTPALFAQTRVPLVADTPAEPATRFVVRLHGGDYEVRASGDGLMHVWETSEKTGDVARLAQKTKVRLRRKSGEMHLEIDPPTGKDGPHVVIELPACAALDLTLTAGELVMHAVPCEATEVTLHAGELRATLGDGERYARVKASVSIGEVDASGLGPKGTDVQSGGFFRSFTRDGAGTRTFAAHVSTGQITLDGKN